MLAVLSVRFTDQPQRWAAAPAVSYAVVGVGSLSGSGGRACGARLGLATGPAGRRRVDVLRSAPAAQSSRRWLLYPVLAVLVVASIGGGFQTVARRSTRGPIRRRANWWTSVDASCICTAPAPEAPPSSWNPVTEEARLTGMDRAGNRPRQPSLRVRPRWSRMERPRRRSPRRRPDRGGPEHTLSIAHMFPGRTFLPVTRSAASTR